MLLFAVGYDVAVVVADVVAVVPVKRVNYASGLVLENTYAVAIPQTPEVTTNLHRLMPHIEPTAKV